MNLKRVKEFIIERSIFLSGMASIVFVILIFSFLLKEGLPFFRVYPLRDFFTGRFWYPISEPAQFGIIPLILGSLIVTLGAILIVVPLGLATAIFIAEIAQGKSKEILKCSIEFLETTPSVVIGFIGLVVLAPFIRKIFGL